MKGLSLGRQHLEFFVNKDLIYVDKTPIIYKLVQEGSVYFLSRPRRFGKSLTVDILKNIYLGKQHLFKNLWVYDKIEWKEHPVIHLDFSTLGFHEIGLRKAIIDELNSIAKSYDISLRKKDLVGSFKELIEKLSTKGKIALLVDEYDKPITDSITNLEQANKNRETLREFYAVLKGIGNKFSIIFITGIAKFAKVSLFSVLNHLTDLSLNRDFANLTGITQQELLEYYGDYLDQIATNLNTPKGKLLTNVKKMYDGYSWDGETFVYNPFSLLNFLNEGRFKNYWIKTGTPKFLVDILRTQRARIEKIEAEEYEEDFFDSFDIRYTVIPTKLLLFQTGYLTIQHIRYETRREYYQLGYPNEEVERAFLRNLLEAYSFKQPTIVNGAIVKLEKAIYNRNIKEIKDQLNVLLSDISHLWFPFEKKEPDEERMKQEFMAWEGYFHTIIYLVLQYLGVHIQCEVTKHKGRIDAIIEVPDYVYITEFKLNDASKAIQQIKTEKYAHSYLNSSKEVVLMGIAFDREKREVLPIVWEIWDRKI